MPANLSVRSGDPGPATPAAVRGAQGPAWAATIRQAPGWDPARVQVVCDDCGASGPTRDLTGRADLTFVVEAERDAHRCWLADEHPRLAEFWADIAAGRSVPIAGRAVPVAASIRVLAAVS